MDWQIEPIYEDPDWGDMQGLRVLVDDVCANEYRCKHLITLPVYPNAPGGVFTRSGPAPLRLVELQEGIPLTAIAMIANEG